MVIVKEIKQKNKKTQTIKKNPNNNSNKNWKQS